MHQSLPIDAVHAEVTAALDNAGCIIYAPPGSGKTTRVPLWCINNGTTFVLIPTRVAVLFAANRLASQLDEQVGNTVGYRLRLDSKTSRHTKIIVTTYGSFLQAILNDPEQLAGSTVIYDEFHERSLDQDLCFALVHQFIALFDDSIKQIFMSATLNVEQIKNLTSLPLIETQGKSFPIDIHYQPINLQYPDQLLQLIESTWQANGDHVLVFLDGWRSISQLSKRLKQHIPCMVLHGKLDTLPSLDSLSTAPATVILATNIAESSITLSRVHTVIDSGLERFASTHPVTGLTRLTTRRISQSSATQRAGRAGRLAPGSAIRCWSEDEQRTRVIHQPPEMDYANLDQLLLHVAAWGAQVDELHWLNPPSKQRLAAAEQKLSLWRALDNNKQLTDHGRAMVKTGLEPWLAHFFATAQNQQLSEAALLLATSINSKSELSYDPLTQRHLPRLTPVEKKELTRLQQRLAVTFGESFAPLTEGLLIEAFSDRLVWHSGSKAQFITGTAVRFQNPQHQASGILLDGQRSDSGIVVFQLLPLSQAAILQSSIVKSELSFRPQQKPNFLLQRKLGAIVLEQQAYQPNNEQRKLAWLNFISTQGESALPLTDELFSLKQRWQFAAIMGQVEKWPEHNWPQVIEPFLTGIKHLNEIDLAAALQHFIGYEAWQKLQNNYPISWQAPSGRRVTLDYDATTMHIAVEIKLQEVFGLVQQPVLGNTPITLKLTAPNGRPVAQVTDIKHFWQHIYPEVRKELRGRYAKHPWPENPLLAIATAKTNRQLSNNSFSN